MLAQLLHVQVASTCNPLLRHLDRQSTHQAQTRFPVGEDPHNPSAPFYLLVESLQAVCGADAPSMALGEGQASEAFLDVLFEVASDLLVAPASPPIGHARCDPEGLLPVRRGEDRAQVRPELLAL